MPQATRDVVLKAHLPGSLHLLILLLTSLKTRLASNPSKMSFAAQCYASCPASTVTIQPPPFVLTIPGPALYCPNEPFGIQQYNPCAYSRGGYGSSSLYASEGSNLSSFFSRALPSSSFSRCSYRSY